MKITRLRASVCLVALAGAAGMSRSVDAAKIKLTDGTEISAAVMGRDGKSVALKLERASVASIDGKPLPAPVIEGSPAPAFSVVDMAGTTQTLGSANGEATLLHFWASWCPHCRHDVDAMKALFAKYQGKGVRVVTVGMDEDVGKLTTFIHDQQLPYPVVVAYAKPDTAESRLPDQYEVRGFPAYFLIDARGIVVKTISGSVAESHIDLDSLIKGLLPGEAPGTSPTHRP